MVSINISLVLFYSKGPRVSVALAINKQYTLSGEPIAMELTLQQSQWIVSKTKLNITAIGVVAVFLVLYATIFY